MSRTLTLARAGVASAICDLVEKMIARQNGAAGTRVAADTEVQLANGELEEALDQWERALVGTLEDR